MSDQVGNQNVGFLVSRKGCTYQEASKPSHAHSGREEEGNWWRLKHNVSIVPYHDTKRDASYRGKSNMSIKYIQLEDILTLP